MNRTGQIGNEKKIFSLTLLIVALVLVLLAPKAAVNVDEQLHYPHAKKVINWYSTGGKDQSCLDTPHTNLKYYGQSADNLTALFNRIFKVKHEFLTRHYTGALFFWLLLLFTGILSQRLTGSWLISVFCVLSLVFMPRLSGQAFGNLKDIPFAAGYIAGLAGIVQFLKELPHPRWKTTLFLGLAIAFTVSIRAGGYILLAYFGPALLLYLGFNSAYLKQIISSKIIWKRLLLQVITIFLLGWFAGILFWPYALQNVIEHPLESLRMMEHYQVSIRQVFEGRMLWSTELPWYYLLKWIFISTPLFVMTGFFLFLWFFFRKIKLRKQVTPQICFEGFILFAIAFPVFYVIAIGSNLYSGVRQMLFIFPPMALLAVWGVYQWIRTAEKRNRKTACGLLVLFFLILVWPVKHQATTFPVDYVYFNALAGGNKKAWGNYEYDYYFHAVKEPVDRLTEMAGSDEITVAMNCNLSNYFDHHPNIEYQYTRILERSSYDWDYAIFGINYLHPHLMKNSSWKPEGTIKTFYHKGNPVAVLIKRKDKNDFYGISEIKNGNLHLGIQLMEQAMKTDTNNVWLLVNLAKAKLAAGDVSGFDFYMEKGKRIHPFYEPLLLLEASRFFEEKDYRASLDKLNALLKINSRYLPARELLEEVKKKLN
jgi:hypothetical protein